MKYDEIKSARLSILLKMKQAGLTNKDLCEETGLTSGRITQILKSKDYPISLDRLVQIDQAVNRIVKQRITRLNSIKL